MKQTFDHLNDTQLMYLIRQDNELALQVLFDRHYDGLLELALHFIKNMALAEEVVADVFLKIWEKRKFLMIKKEVKPYLLVTAKNLSINMLSKEKYSFHASPQMDTAGTVDPATEMQYNEMFQQIDHLIAQMPTQRQLVFRLNRLDGLAYKEIAELMEISVETVQKHMSQAVRFMVQHKEHIKGMIHYLSMLTSVATFFI